MSLTRDQRTIFNEMVREFGLINTQGMLRDLGLPKDKITELTTDWILSS